MRFRDPHKPAEDELRAWATDENAVAPIQDWDLILTWAMEPGLLRVCVELAADAACPNASFFLMVLYHWVAVVARSKHFEQTRSIYEGWMNVVRGVSDPAVKRWRHETLLIFQGIESFNWEQWWVAFSNEQSQSPK